ncbi:L-type lectin-domain containing receptor kinase S.4-like [Diospyros lotus]|uniref:L-type lectin-domain containing receptor kinase S.4-like n=1 Tax=Diospyros lotus TaxID=55363 RepID=UPI002252B141|nr:L-type lectin-domain containing receptor kinase S.4-like [Diospyros lotus]
MTRRPEVLWAMLLLLANAALADVQEFVYHGFKTGGMSLTGAAGIEKNGVLKLTNDTHLAIGHAFHPFPIAFKNSSTGKAYSFSAAFAFAVVPEYPDLGGHGFAFVISPSKELACAFPRQYLGLFCPNNNGNFSNHLLAVEFDTVQNFEFRDINDNHVGIDVNGMISKASAPASYFIEGNLTRQKVNLMDGKTIQAWIDYDSARNKLNVTISPSSTKPSSPILSFPVELSEILEERMFVGFSASTGLLASHHYIRGWSFKINGEAQPLDLSSLPSLPRKKHSRLVLAIGVSFSVFAVIVSAVGMVFYFRIRRVKKTDRVEDWELDIGPHRLSHKELKQVMRGFGDEDLLGFGASGRVYRGTLPNTNTQVAVKRISHDSKEGFHEFASEIATLGRLRHRNLVPLLGWYRCGGELLLVYDYMPNGSLDKYIYNEAKRILRWEERFKIIKGVASGLLYLHEEWEETVIHRDIKAGNVLLDSEFNGRLGDFGLAKLYKHGSDASTTRVVGTLGYLAPELTRTGKPTASSDVFAFGALLLEVVCGRRPIEAKALPEELFLVDWVWEWWREGALLDVVDPRLGGKYNEAEVLVVLKLGLMCSNNVPANRPTMRQMVSYLEGEVELPEMLLPAGRR